MWKEIVKGNSVCIYGPKGVGKTFLLKKIVSEFNGIFVNSWTPSGILKALLKAEGIKPMGTIEEMLKLVLRFVRNRVIGIDDYHLLGKVARRIVLKLQQNIVIITSIKKEQGFVNKHLAPSYKRCIEALNSFPLRPEEKKIIAEHACGLPKEAIRIAYYVMNGFKLREIRPGIAKINLVKIEHVMLLALFLLFAKYLLYYNYSFKEAYIVAMFAYSTLIVLHIVRKLNK